MHRLSIKIRWIRMTIVNTTESATQYLNFFEESYSIPLGENLKSFNDSVRDKKIHADGSNLDFLDFRSSKTKILCSTGWGPFNHFFTFVTTIVALSKKFPDATFILDYSSLYMERNAKTFIPFTKKIFNLLGIENYFINNMITPGIIVNNFYTSGLGTVTIVIGDVADTVNLYKKLINNKNKPFRKVYLSRKNLNPRHYSCIPEGLSTNVDHRVYDEEKLEEYFRKNGVEVVCPEDFKTMEEQALFFSEVEVVFSSTSSGLANSMFMQDNTVVVELCTSFPGILEGSKNDKNCHGTETLHSIYKDLSYFTNKQYVSIPNYTRQAGDLIGIIEESKLLQGLLRA